MAATPVTINHIDQLSQFSDQSLPLIYLHNVVCIFNSEHENLTKILDSKTPTILMKIRQSQLIKVEELDSKFEAKHAHKRNVKTDKHYIVQDILLLGKTLAVKSPVENLDQLVYAFPEETDELDTLDLSDPTVLKNTIKQLFKTTKDQKHEIGLLKENRDALATEVAILKARMGLDDPNEEVSAQAGKPIPSVPNDLPEADEPQVSEPQVSEPRPIKGVVKTTNIFIGSIAPPCTTTDILDHIKGKTTFTPKLTDITKLKVRGENLAFKVSVPKNKVNEVLNKSTWDEGIIAELYNPQKQQLRMPKGARSHGNNKLANKKQTFRKQSSLPHKPPRQNYSSNYWSVPPRDQSYIPYSQHIPTNRNDGTSPDLNNEWTLYSRFSEHNPLHYGYQI